MCYFLFFDIILLSCHLSIKGNTMSNKVFRYKFYDCILVKNQFQADGSTCLNLIAADTPFNRLNDIFPNEAIARASIHVEYASLEPNQTIIRDYAETSGLVDVLVEEGFVEKISKINLGIYPNGTSVDGVLVKILI